MWAAEIIAAGFEDAYRSQQFCGSADSADVICKELDRFHFEVKYTERVQIYAAIEQAKRDSNGLRIPVVAHHKNRGEWLVTMRAEDWLKLEKERLDVSKM